MIPYADLRTLFLDVGNTLLSVDFHWIADELGSRGHACSPASLKRAEAAARPAVSDWLSQGSSTEAEASFGQYLLFVFERVPELRPVARPALEALVAELVPVLRIPGRADLLWRSVMPGVPEALDRIGALGLKVVAVSNADGSVARGLATAGLQHHFSQILDSAVVGYEKPDPRLFEEALRRSGAVAERTLHVGDIFHADVVGARAAGVHAALLDPFGDWAEVDCPVFPDLSALVEEIARSR